MDSSGFKQYDSERANFYFFFNNLEQHAPSRANRKHQACFCLFVIEVLNALHMDTMMSHVDSWRRNPESFLRERGLNTEPAADPNNEEVFVLIVEGFLIFNHRLKKKKKEKKESGSKRNLCTQLYFYCPSSIICLLLVIILVFLKINVKCFLNFKKLFLKVFLYFKMC